MGRHAVSRSRTTVSLIALGSAAALVAGILSVNGAATADAPRLSDNLVQNSDFEAGTGGWNTQSTKAALTSGLLTLSRSKTSPRTASRAACR